jgi:hypothetical protein
MAMDAAIDAAMDAETDAAMELYGVWRLGMTMAERDVWERRRAY